MSFSFNAAAEPMSAKDWCRSMLGDTQSATAVLSDEQILGALAAAGGDERRAIALPELAAMAVAAIVREPVKIVGPDLTIDLSDRLVALKPLADQWHAQQVVARQAGTQASRTPSTAAPIRPTW